MALDIPVLIQQSRNACEVLEESIQKNGRSLDQLVHLLDGTGARLDAVSGEAEHSVQSFDQTLNQLDSTLDSLLDALGNSMSTLSDRATSSREVLQDGVDSLKAASSQLASQCSVTNGENRTRLESQVEGHGDLQGQLDSLLGSLMDGSVGVVSHVGQTAENIKQNHGQVVSSGKLVAEGFGLFTTGVQQHSTTVQSQLDQARQLSQKQLDQLQADLTRQLDEATAKVRAALEQAAKGANHQGDQVEMFLGNLIQALGGVQNTVDNAFRPPVQMIGNVQDKLQPIINLIGTLRDLGLV